MRLSSENVIHKRFVRIGPIYDLIQKILLFKKLPTYSLKALLELRLRKRMSHNYKNSCSPLVNYAQMYPLLLVPYAIKAEALCI